MVGTLNAESFVERMFSCAGGVMDEGNSLLSEDFLEKLTILRMNKKFMGFMRAHRNDIAQQEFKMTVIRPARRGLRARRTGQLLLLLMRMSGRPPTPWTPSSRVSRRRRAATTGASTSAAGRSQTRPVLP